MAISSGNNMCDSCWRALTCTTNGRRAASPVAPTSSPRPSAASSLSSALLPCGEFRSKDRSQLQA